MSNTDKINFYLLLPLFLFVLIFALSKRVNAETELPPQDKINVFAVVSENIENSFTEAAKILNEEEQLESFPLQGYQIHCTLYMTQYPTGILSEVQQKIASLASSTKVFDINTTGLEITDGDWFFMNLDRNRNLQTLSDAVTELLSPLRAPSDYVPEWAKNSPSKVDYIKKYGSPNVYEEFNPHLTFLPRSDGEKLKSFLGKHSDKSFCQPVKGQIVAIGVGIADKNGQMKEALQVFPLQPMTVPADAPAKPDGQN